MVKVGTKWVTPADRDALIGQAGANAELARQYMKQGRAKEAEPLLMDVAVTDPTNATAQYLIGLLKYQQEQVPAARKAFEATAIIIPNHAPTLNNLGVVEWRQHQVIAALQSFDAAMLSSPIDKTVLDNVAVALQNVPADLQKSPVTLKVVRHFTEQDQKLAERMAHDGMHRFGSLWVSDHDLDLMKAQEKDISDKLDALAGDFDRSKDRISKLETAIADDQTDMQRIAANSFTIDPRTGAQIPVPLPSTYYDLQRDQQKKSRERESEISKLDLMKKQAQDLQNSRPSIRSQGVMQIIGTEGTPIKIAGPAVAPAAR
jgi:tetratricopeptide (TPR) repeat protein